MTGEGVVWGYVVHKEYRGIYFVMVNLSSAWRGQNGMHLCEHDTMHADANWLVVTCDDLRTRGQSRLNGHRHLLSQFYSVSKALARLVAPGKLALRASSVVLGALFW